MMRAQGAFALIAILVGCDGRQFTTASADAAADGSAPEAAAVEAEAREAGYAGAGGSGGAAGLGALSPSGGAFGSGGSSGGAFGSGGSSGGASDSGGSVPCASVAHDNGVGQHWQDCVPLGTHDSAQAMKACNAWCVYGGVGCQCVVGYSCSDGLERVLAAPAANYMSWAWQGPSAGHVVRACSAVGTWS